MCRGSGPSIIGQLLDVVVFGVGAYPTALEVSLQYDRVIWEGICEAG